MEDNFDAFNSNFDVFLFATLATQGPVYMLLAMGRNLIGIIANPLTASDTSKNYSYLCSVERNTALWIGVDF